MIDSDRVPVIAAIGEITDRPIELADALEPLDLMKIALQRADAEAFGKLLKRVDSLDVINQISWPYTAPAHELCARLKISPPRIVYGRVGGETPVRLLHAAAARIAAWQSTVAALCGGESHHSVARAQAKGESLPWTPASLTPAASIRGLDTARPLARRLQAYMPITVYPFFENAAAHGLGQSPQQALNEIGILWSSLSEIAARNPYAWLTHTKTPSEIMLPSAANRCIAHPYTKLMVANIAVNQGAAVLLTSLSVAKQAGLDDGRLIFLHQGFAADEPDDYLLRDGYALCHSRDLVLEHSAQAVGGNGFDAVELYSCFPCVPKAARRTLGLSPSFATSVTGGLTFFGAPLNNYMTHAACAMTRHLRAKPGTGLLYGQGGFATKHHTLVLGTQPPDSADELAGNPDLQSHVARRYGPVPIFDESPTGLASIESHTVVHARDGTRHGVAIVRTQNGARSLARIPPSDLTGLAMLESTNQYAVGQTGRISQSAEGMPDWRAL
jgi:acetyl-CoA C-acetyltransferase